MPSTFGRYPFTITTAANCPWSARTDVTWADVATGSGTGSATPMLNVSENLNRDTRTVEVTINGQIYRVVQQIPTCSYTVKPTTLDLGGLGGSVFLDLTTGPGCPWTASAGEIWIKVPISSGAGSAEVEFVLETNPGGSPRTAYLTLAGVRVNLVQQRKP